MSEALPTLMATLQRSTEGLLWMSETDEPFAVFHWQKQTVAELTDERLLQLTHHPVDTPVEVVDMDAFFSGATEEQDWFGDEEKATAQAYRELVATLKQHLSNLKVYRVGETAIDLYVVGQTDAGDVVGLATKAVET